MSDHCRPKAICRWLAAVAAAVVGLGEGAPAANQTAGSPLDAYPPLRAEFDRQLSSWAGELEAAGCDGEAAWLRQWVVDRDPGRHYYFLPPPREPARPGSAAASAMETLDAAQRCRQAYADALFALAAEAAEAGEGSAAFAWLHEVCQVWPDHERARRALGDRRVAGAWSLLDSPLTVRRPASRHALLGWEGGSYQVVESPHYAVSSRASEAATRAAVMLLERSRCVWRQAFFEYGSSPRELANRVREGTPERRASRHKIVLFADRDQYTAELQRLGVAGVERSTGYYNDRHRTAFFFVDDPLPSETWVQEQAHQLFQETGPTRSDPFERSHVWLQEGLGTYFESLVDGGSVATLGGFDAARLQFARVRCLREGYLMPLDELTALGRKAFQTHPRVTALYSQAAGLTHFFLHAEGGRYRAALLELARRAYQQRARLETLSELTGVAPPQLEVAYRQWLPPRADSVLRGITAAERRTELALGFSDVDDRIVLQLARCSELEWLQLSRTAVRDGIAPALEKMPRLRQLFLDGTRVGNGVLAALQGMDRLEELDLAGTAVDDDGMPQLARLTSLKILWLGSTGLTDRGLAELSALQNLERLNVDGTEVTPEALARLRQKLPHLK